METYHSDRFIVEPTCGHPKIDEPVSTSSKPKSKDPFLLLPPDVLAKIMGFTSIAQWHALESLHQNFHEASLMAWRQLRDVNVERDFSTKSESIESILQQLLERSPFLTSLRGIDLQMIDARLNTDTIRLLAQFEHLQSITLGAKLFTGRQGIQLENAVEFLETTCSRSSLRVIRLYNVVQSLDDRSSILDRFAPSFSNGSEIQSPLKLEKFVFTSCDPSLRIRLDTMDTTRLTELCIEKAWIEPQQLSKFIERASSLRRIELSFLPCSGVCNGTHLQANRQLLRSLASHDNLTEITFDRCDFSNDIKCVNFWHDFMNMLQAIGRRGQLKKVAMEHFFVPPFATDMDEVCATICTYMPDLESIKLRNGPLTESSVRNIVSLAELEEIDLMNWNIPLTANVIRKIAQLPHLKRLAFDSVSDQHTNSLMCLADLTSLTDLRIGNARGISAAILERWSDGFASNLQTLMLYAITEDGVVRLLEKAVRLRVVILEGRVTDQSLITIARSCPKLEILGVRSTANNISARYLQDIVDRCAKLKQLGGFGYEIRNQLQFPKYRKIGDVHMYFSNYELFDDDFDD